MYTIMKATSRVLPPRSMRSRIASAPFLWPLAPWARGLLSRLRIFRYQVVGARSSRPSPQRAFGLILAHPNYATGRFRHERQATNSRSPREACATTPREPRRAAPAFAAVDTREPRAGRARAYGPLVCKPAG